MKVISGDWLSNPATQRVMKMLTDAGHQAYFVGGCVRNTLMGIAVGDIDIATSALPQLVMTLCASEGLQAIPTGMDHGTVTVISAGLAHEITTFRRDVQTDGRHAVVAFSDNITEDARRRDFTMNALYASSDGIIHDPLNGIDDLIARRVRFVGHAETRIKEDYLRILRFFRFTAWYGKPGQGVDPDALAAISVNLPGLDTLSRERVGAEIKKLLSAKNPAPAVGIMALTGVLARVLPGAEQKYLAPLVEIDGDDPVDPLRRLAILGGQNVARNLRFSRAESKWLDLLVGAIGTTDPVAVLAYRYGARAAMDIELLRAAVFERVLRADFRAEADRGANAVFPVGAVDLMPDLQGVALGQRLRQLEQRWTRSDFTLTKPQLLPH